MILSVVVHCTRKHNQLSFQGIAMYIRWNKNWAKKGDYIYAILAENRALDGKIRPKTIKCLGGIRKNHPSPYRRFEIKRLNRPDVYSIEYLVDWLFQMMYVKKHICL